ncbi:hypothetical protein D3C83_142580 [compost metagenome]
MVPVLVNDAGNPGVTIVWLTLNVPAATLIVPLFVCTESGRIRLVAVLMFRYPGPWLSS